MTLPWMPPPPPPIAVRCYFCVIRSAIPRAPQQPAACEACALVIAQVGARERGERMP